MKKPEISLGRAAGEFAVIVLGVLVALGVDGWNQGRKDSALEGDYLQRLEEDVRADWITTLADRANTGPVRDEVRKCVDTVLR